MPQTGVLSRVRSRYRNNVQRCRLRALVPTQEELAKRTQLSRSVISALETQRIFLSAHYALLIAEALDCRLDDLYEKINQE